MLRKIKIMINDRTRQQEYFRWIFRLSKPHIKSIVLLIFLNCSISVAGILSAVINKYIVDQASLSLKFTAYIALAVLFTAFSLAANVLFSILSLRTTEKYSYHIRSQMYSHILQATWSERRRYHSEDFLSRLTSDVNIVVDGVVNVSVMGIATIIQFLMAFLLLWHYDTSLALVAMITGPVAAIVSLFIGNKLKRIHCELQQSEADYRIYLQERISYADTIKVFGQEAASLQKLDTLHKKRMHWVKEKNRWKLYASTIINLVFSGTYLFAFCTGAVKIGTGAITYGTMTAFLALVGQVQTPLYMFANLLPQTFGVLASAGRIRQISELKTELSGELGIPLQEGKPIGINGKDITFSYGSQKVVSNFNMKVSPGEMVMLRGDSGIGKTTLLRGILGFLTPEEGTLSLYDEEGNSQPCSAISRECISYVQQGNTLFTGTIEENLRMGSHSADYQQMKDALKIAFAWDFVKVLPKQMQTLIGEKGHGFSEGQAQRIAIARALLRPCGLLIMDEATSALDEETEEKIIRSLNINIKNKTCLFVSHRSTIARLAERIIEIKNI